MTAPDCPLCRTNANVIPRAVPKSHSFVCTHCGEQIASIAVDVDPAPQSEPPRHAAKPATENLSLMPMPGEG